MPEPTITFTTAFIDLNEDRSKDKSPEVRIKHFKTLAKSGIAICLYVSSTYENIGKELENEFKNVKLMPIINLEELETYKIIKKLNPELPINRNNEKDTLNYMILQNAKSEFVYKTLISNPFNTEHFAWIDFSICHMITDLEYINNKLYTLKQNKLIKSLLLFPSCWSKEISKEHIENNSIYNSINWRFCGSFFIGDSQSILDMHLLIINLIYNFIYNENNKNNTIAWEINLWAWIEELYSWKVLTYKADHNNSILDVPFNYFENKNTIINNELINNELINNELINNELINNELINNELINNKLINNQITFDYKNKYKSTIVTFYFNLTKLKDSTETIKDETFYMKKGIETLQLKNPMVIFCDETNYITIKNIRDNYVKDNTLTKYIIKNITEYDFYKKNIDIIINNRKNIDYYRNSSDTSSYYIICIFKIISIYISKTYNFFNTDYYVWIDFAGSHIMRKFNTSIHKILNNPNPKVSLCYIHYRNNEEILKLLNNNICFCGIAAGCFTVDKHYVDIFYANIMNIFYDLLNKKIGHTEEQILTLFHDKYPDLCTIYYGDYYSILINYHEIIDDVESIIYFYIKEAIKKNRYDLALICAKSIMDSFYKNNITLEDSNILFLKNIINKKTEKKKSKSNIHNYVDKVIYINLESRTDRKEEIENELNNFNIEYERFNAIVNKKYGYIGCMMSHLEVIKMAKQKNYKNILILEDDFTFTVSKDIFEKNIDLLFKSNVNFNICMLSYHLMKSTYNSQYRFLNNVLEAQTTSGYIINENMYDIMIELYSWSLSFLNLTKSHHIYAVDMIWKILQPITNWYCFSERLGKQRMSYSNIENSITNYNC